MNSLDIVFIVWAFLIIISLILHFSMRKWAFRVAMRYGWIIYALGIPSAVLSFLMIINQRAWSFWVAGIIFLIWGFFGYSVEYIRKINWRSPIRWEIFFPYVILYLVILMFYWFPVGILSKPLWYVYAILFIICTWLNISSH